MFIDEIIREGIVGECYGSIECESNESDPTKSRLYNVIEYLKKNGNVLLDIETGNSDESHNLYVIEYNKKFFLIDFVDTVDYWRITISVFDRKKDAISEYIEKLESLKDEVKDCMKDEPIIRDEIKNVLEDIDYEIERAMKYLSDNP